MQTNPNRTLRLSTLAGALLALAGAAHAGTNQGTAFIYQGELRTDSALVSGTYDLMFSLHSDELGTVQVGPVLCADDVAVVGGRFTVSLDFGDVFGAEKRYLFVRARSDSGAATACSSVDGYTDMGPLGAVESTAWAQWADSAATCDEATTATTATLATSTDKLAGQPLSHYRNAANLTGALPASVISGTYPNAVTLSNLANVLVGDGSALRGVRTATAPFAPSVVDAGVTENAAQIGGVNPSVFRDITQITGVFPRSSLGGTYNGMFRFLNASNSFAGNGAGLTTYSLSNIVTGVFPGSAIEGTFNQPATFSGWFTGDGTQLTNLNASNFSNNFSLTQAPAMSFAFGHQATLSGSYTSGTAQAITQANRTVTVPFAGTAIMNWTISAGTPGPAPLGMAFTPSLNGTTLEKYSDLYFNTAGVHQFVSGTTTFPVSAGSQTFGLSVKRTAGTASMDVGSTNAVTYSVIIVR